MKKSLLLLAALILNLVATTAQANAVRNAEVSNDYLSVYSVTQNSFTFSIDLEGYYLFYPIEAAMLDLGGMDATSYLELFGIPGLDPNVYTWTDGEYYNLDWLMSVKPDRDYILAVVETDADKVIIGDTYTLEFRTPPVETSDASVAIQTSNITSTSITINSTPDSDVMNYYIYVRDKAWYDTIISGYGEGMLATLIKHESAGSWFLTGENTQTWSGLLPVTDYYIGVLAIDTTGAENLQLIPFTTLEASGVAPTINVTLTPHSTEGHNKMMLNIKAENAATIYYAFNANADVKEAQRSGLSNAEIAKQHGNQLSSADMLMVTTASGYTVELENLWRSTDYTCVVCALNAEQAETDAIVIATTKPEPVPARVESDLFETLVGEWVIKYDFIDFQSNTYSIDGAIVKIAAGVDAESTEEYRSLNRLVILDYPFQYDWETNPIASYLPEDLFNYRYWDEDRSLAYRDYGPKLFLEIAEDGSISMPTARNYNLYGWHTNEVLFYGCDYDNQLTAPATFPVTLSADGNTLTIGAHESDIELGNGIYRPAVFMHINGIGDTMRNVALDDIVLQRKDTSVESIEEDLQIRVSGNSILAPQNAEIYSLDGIRVNADNLPTGIYIVRYGDQVTKVAVK